MTNCYKEKLHTVQQQLYTRTNIYETASPAIRPCSCCGCGPTATTGLLVCPICDNLPLDLNGLLGYPWLATGHNNLWHATSPPAADTTQIIAHQNKGQEERDDRKTQDSIGDISCNSCYI
eukprot:sb/3476147/